MFLSVTFQSNDSLNEFLPPLLPAQLHVKEDKFPGACDMGLCRMKTLSVPFARLLARI